MCRFYSQQSFMLLVRNLDVLNLHLQPHSSFGSSLFQVYETDKSNPWLKEWESGNPQKIAEMLFLLGAFRMKIKLRFNCNPSASL